MKIAHTVLKTPSDPDFGVTHQGCEYGHIAVNITPGHAYGIGYVWFPNMVLLMA